MAPRRQPARDDHALRRDRRSRGTVQLVLGVLLVIGCVGAGGAVRAAPSAVPVLASAEALGQNLALLIMMIAGGILIIRGVRKLRD